MKSFIASDTFIKQISSAVIPSAISNWRDVVAFMNEQPQVDSVRLGYTLVDFASDEFVAFAWESGDIDIYAEMYAANNGEESVDLQMAEIILTRDLYEEDIEEGSES